MKAESQISKKKKNLNFPQSKQNISRSDLHIQQSEFSLLNQELIFKILSWQANKVFQEGTFSFKCFMFVFLFLRVPISISSQKMIFFPI